MSEQREKWQGARQIWRFNWPIYVAGSAASTCSAVLALRTQRKYLRAALGAGSALAAWWTIGSFAISHWIYDRSKLCRWKWIADEIETAPARWGNFHAGLDESTLALCALWPQSAGASYDFFDGEVMTEPSIRRARQLFEAPLELQSLTRNVDFRALNLPGKYLPAAFVLFAAHELRATSQRAQFLGELQRVLDDNGVLIIAEHARDAANFVAFGPGFLHFFAPHSWRDLLKNAGFEIQREQRITPFVRVWTCRKMKAKI